MAPHRLPLRLLLLALLARPSPANRLHSAAQRGDTEAVAELLGSADKSGIMPNCDCWWWGLRCEVCAVDDTHRAGLTPAMYAAAHGHAEILRRLSNAGADLNLRNAEGNSAAMHAAIPGDAQVLDMLIKAGADVGLANKDGWTPLLAAANQGHDACLRLLVEAGADLNAQAKNGWGSVMYAAAQGHESTLEILISSGANLRLQNDEGATAVQVAAARGHIKCLKMLMAQLTLADLDHEDKEGFTAAMRTAKAGMPKVLRVMVKMGADLEREVSGKTAVLLAASSGATECLRVLLVEAKVFFDEKEMRKHIRWGAKTRGHEEKLRAVIDERVALDSGQRVENEKTPSKEL